MSQSPNKFCTVVVRMPTDEVDQKLSEMTAAA